MNISEFEGCSFKSYKTQDFPFETPHRSSLSILIYGTLFDSVNSSCNKFVMLSKLLDDPDKSEG